MVELILVDLDIPEGLNIIFGQSHFIKTVEDLYEALTDLVNKPELRNVMGEAGRKWVEENFDRRKIWADLIELYENLIDNNQSTKKITRKN